MNPLAELHERLAYTAAAGTALLDEDFRLKKMMDGFAPLAQKNPVFGKIHAGLTGLFKTAPEQRGTQLLNLLGLVDAVLYTQAGSGAEGDFAEVPEHTAPGSVQQIRYSALCPLIAALTTTGSGRMEVLTSAITEHPEYLTDYRVIHALVSDLADPYGEMAVLVFRTLQALATGQPVYVDTIVDNVSENRAYQLPRVDAEQMVFALKRGFDPAGKTEMKIRLMLVCAIRGGAENDWYLSLLDTAKKDIRALAIFALGFQEENIPRLLELAEKERGKAKEMAYHALARWETPEVLAFMEATLEKAPKLAACLADTASDAYGDLAAACLRAELEVVLDKPVIEKAFFDERIAPYFAALTGKASEGVIALYAWISAQHTRIPRIQHGSAEETSAIQPRLNEIVCETLMLRLPPPLVDFLQQRADMRLWDKACFVADIQTLSAAAFYEKWHGFDPDALRRWMYSLCCDGETTYIRDTVFREAILSLEKDEDLERPLREPLDFRWIDVFIEWDLEVMFAKLPRVLPDVWREKAGAYFYSKAIEETKNIYVYGAVSALYNRLEKMHRYGWKTYDNILVNVCKCYSLTSEHQLVEAFTCYRTYAGEENTRQEALRVLEFYRESGKLSAAIVLEILKEHGFSDGIQG